MRHHSGTLETWNRHINYKNINVCSIIENLILLRGCLRKNLQVNMGLKNRLISYSSILKIYPWEQLKSISFYSNFL
jgi:hypothetical protein